MDSSFNLASFVGNNVPPLNLMTGRNAPSFAHSEGMDASNPALVGMSIPPKADSPGRDDQKLRLAPQTSDVQNIAAMPQQQHLAAQAIRARQLEEAIRILQQEHQAVVSAVLTSQIDCLQSVSTNRCQQEFSVPSQQLANAGNFVNPIDNWQLQASKSMTGIVPASCFRNETLCGVQPNASAVGSFFSPVRTPSGGMPGVSLPAFGAQARHPAASSDCHPSAAVFSAAQPNVWPLPLHSAAVPAAPATAHRSPAATSSETPAARAPSSAPSPSAAALACSYFDNPIRNRDGSIPAAAAAAAAGGRIFRARQSEQKEMRER